MIVEFPPEQLELELELWVERRFTAQEMLVAETRWSEFNFLKNTRQCEVYHSPTSMHTFVRYRV